MVNITVDSYTTDNMKDISLNQDHCQVQGISFMTTLTLTVPCLPKMYLKK